MEYSFHSAFLVIFCLILVIAPKKATAQVHEFGFYAGQATLKRSPDFDYNFGSKSNTSRVLGIVYRFNMNNHFSIQTSFNDFRLNYFKFKDFGPNNKEVNDLADQQVGIDPLFLRPRHPLIRSRNLELLGRLEYYLVPRQLLNWDMLQIRPFIYIGGGVLRQKMNILPILCYSNFPNVDLEEVFDLPLKTQKKVFYRGILNTGIGLSVNATRLVNFKLEFGPRFTGTDNLDCFEQNNTNDWYFIYGISTTISIKSFPMVNTWSLN